MHLKAKPPVSMVTKLIRRDRDNVKEMRGGTRGGRDQFKWNDIKQMSYKDRECYLGYTSKIGYLDKGGKWKKGDWYKNINRKKKIKKNDLKKKLQEIKRKEKERMEIALGLKKDDKADDISYKKFNQKQTINFTKRVKDVEKDEFKGTFGLGYKKNNSTKTRKVDLSRNFNRLKGDR